MSSASLQNPGISVSAFNTTSPLGPASPSSRYYQASHPSPTQEAYHAPRQVAEDSPAPSSRRPSRRPSGNNNNNNNTTVQSGHNSPMSSRAAILSPVAVTTEQQQQQPASSDRERRRNNHNMPAAVPPRTSSTQHQGSTSRSGQTSSRGYAGEQQRGTDSPGKTRLDQQYAEDDGTAAQTSRSSRQQHYSSQIQEQQQQQQQQRGSNRRDDRSNLPSINLAGRSQQQQQQPVKQAPLGPPSGPSREASEILNSILISQPEVDIERARQRDAQAQPQRQHQHQHVADLQDDIAAPPPPIVSAEHTQEDTRRRSRHDHSKREKQTKFGEYILGNTIGEGEFGKVKLGWKANGPPDQQVEVAIKLIKKDALGSNPTRMAKIMREVAILRQLTHPNIVRLHKMEESERHYGIVLEYASGGELFDYILNHRYLKDNAARRLFAQLISGVGYLHKKGIVHRDLKLENLLLDRHKNIIITDFGFANTFDPTDELSEEEELNLSDREFVKRMQLDKANGNGHRKGDLMQTSCGSPCYAAPELVVSDSLYTGRKVDVWSCGVILYAMLAGYLPFDDDPANPEGDNINLLYKYIVNTPLTFPEYVTPHARDLLRRILVPNPRKRADLFEVARHSWLSEYAHVVELITSATTTPSEIQNTTITSDDVGDNPVLARSNSVRESSKKATLPPALGGLTTKQGTIDQEVEQAVSAKTQKDAKRRTVQVEYVAPRTQTQRGESQQAVSARSHARSGSQGPVDVRHVSASSDKPLPSDPPVTQDAYGRPNAGSRRPPSAHKNNTAPMRPNREGSRSDNPYMSSATAVRPPTGGSMQSTRSQGGRASYGQPLAPEVADTSVHGRIQQPPKGSGKGYGAMASPGLDQGGMDYVGRPSISVPDKFAQVSGFAGEGQQQQFRPEVKGHRRSNTLGEISGKIFGRSASIFGGRNRKKADHQQQQHQAAQQQQQQQQQPGEKQKRYPPVSMNNSMPGGDEPRPSIETGRSRMSFSLGRKRSGSVSGSQTSIDRSGNRRFSLLKAIGIGKDYSPPSMDSQQDLPIHEPPQVDQYGRYVEQRPDREQTDMSTVEGMYNQLQLQDPAERDYRQAQQQRLAPQDNAGYSAGGRPAYAAQGAALNTGSESSFDYAPRRATGSAPHIQQQQQQQQPPQQPLQPQQQPYATNQQQQQQPAALYDNRRVASAGKPSRGVLQKPKRGFVDAWDTDESSKPHDHSGSSGPARKVMDFFRRRGKARGEDR